MKIPKKITPDHLKDTVVEVRFDTSVSLDLLAGMASSILKKAGFSYTPLNPNSSSESLNLNKATYLSGFFDRDLVKIQFVDNEIAFNCFADKYPGWKNYSKTIKEILTLLVNEKAIDTFNRIAFRYISEFENVDIFDNVRGNIDLKDTGINLKNSILRLTKDIDNVKIFITTANPINAKTGMPNSIVDINVFENLPKDAGIKILEEELDKIHLLQKETFFNFVSESFIQTLNPEY